MLKEAEEKIIKRHPLTSNALIDILKFLLEKINNQAGVMQDFMQIFLFIGQNVFYSLTNALIPGQTSGRLKTCIVL